MIVKEYIKEFEKLGIEVIGFMPTDAGWTFEEYFN
jgi:hypothetical protein